MALSEKQRRFCDYYIQTGNASEAAVRAGYSKKTAKQMGCENLTKPDLVKYIHEKNKELESNRIMDMREVKELWTNIARGQEIDADMKDRLKASEYLAKTNGAFLDKVEHSGEIKHKNPYENLTEDELRKLANK